MFISNSTNQYPISVSLKSIRPHWYIISGLWVVYFVLVYVTAHQGELGLNAFDAYYRAAEALLNQEPLYNGVEGWIYLYPPLLAQLLTPFIKMTNYITIVNIWLMINFVLLISTIGLLARYVRPAHAKWLWLAPMFFLPFWQALYLGQITIIMLVLLVACWQALKENRPVVVGSILALAIWIKVFPILLILYFLLKQHWRVIYSTIIAGFGLMAFQILTLGPEPMLEFIETLFTLTVGGQPEATYENLSIFAFVSRLFQENIHVEPLTTNNTLYTTTRITLTLIILSITGLAISRSKSIFAWQQDLSYGLVIVTVLIIGSTLWISGLPSFLLIYVIIISSRMLESLKENRIIVLLTGLSFVLITIYQPLILILLEDTLPALVLSIGFFGVMLLWIILVYLLLRPTN